MFSTRAGDSVGVCVWRKLLTSREETSSRPYRAERTSWTFRVTLIRNGILQHKNKINELYITHTKRKLPDDLKVKLEQIQKFFNIYLPHTGQRSLSLSVCAAVWSHRSATVPDWQVCKLCPDYSAASLGQTNRPLQRPPAARSSQHQTAGCPAEGRMAWLELGQQALLGK